MNLYKYLIFLFCLLTFLKVANTTAYAANENCNLTAGFWVEDSFYDFFDPTKNPQSTNTFGQWSDRQMQEWNKILASSGVKDCFKIGKIVRVGDDALPLNDGVPTNNPDNKNRSVDVIWGFPAKELSTPDSLEYWTKVRNSTDWSLLHELSHARYLIDEYGLDFGLTYDQLEVTDPMGKPLVNNYFKPIRWDVIYYNKSNDLMGGGKNSYALHSAEALNRVTGQHYAEEYGNFNAPGNLGAYLSDLPENNILKILDNQGNPLENTQVKIYQSQKGDSGHIYAKKIDNTVEFDGVTNPEGKISIGANPFGPNKSPYYPDYKIDPYASNALLLLGVFYQDQFFYKFIEVSDFNLAYWAGATSEATYDIRTNIKSEATGNITSTPIPTNQPAHHCFECKGSRPEIPPAIYFVESYESNCQNVCLNNLGNACVYQHPDSPSCRPQQSALQAEQIKKDAQFKGQDFSMNCQDTDITNCLESTLIPMPRISINPTPTPKISKILISNYSDFRSLNSSGDLGSPTITIDNPNSQTITWTLSTLNSSPKKPFYIRVITNDEFKDYAPLEMGDGDFFLGTNETANIKIQAKMVKKITKMTITINGQDQDVDINNPTDIPILLQGSENQPQKFSIPYVIEYSNGEIARSALVLNYLPVNIPSPTAIATPIQPIPSAIPTPIGVGTTNPETTQPQPTAPPVIGLQASCVSSTQARLSWGQNDNLPNTYYTYASRDETTVPWVAWTLTGATEVTVPVQPNVTFIWKARVFGGTGGLETTQDGPEFTCNE